MPDHTGKEEVLFSLKNGADVYTDEFEYAYQKNNFNNDQANTRQDIQEYLDLYVIFKQKVQAAKALGMDTSRVFLNEFNGYKESLADSYINTKDLTENLIKEAYDRYQEEVAASHILIRLTDSQDTLTAYRKMDSIRQLAIQGEDFASLARTYSEDPSAKVNNGDLGYFTSMRMVYAFESAAYNTSIGQISDIVKTRFGYHILHVRDRRPTRGKVSVSHIMIRSGAKVTDEEKDLAKNKIFEIQDQLDNGVDWDFLCKQFSEDSNTRSKGGKLAPFSAGQMPPVFGDAAFDLENIGDYSDPVMTPYGWHIIKLDEKIPVESYDQMKPKIKNHISRDERVNITEKALVKKLKVENSFSEYPNRLIAIDSTILTGKWTHESSPADTATIFTIGKKKYSIGDYYEYIIKDQKPIRGKSLQSYRQHLYDKFVKKSLVRYAKDHLADNNVEYRMLVKEYREGILLFNLMNDKVWNKAVKDTSGLHTYFNNNRENYRWNDRVEAIVYNAGHKEIIDEIKTLLDSEDSSTLTSDNLLKKYNSESNLNLKIKSGLLAKKDLDVLGKIPWEVGKHELSMEGRAYLVVIEKIIPSKIKELEECKGLVISDYQNVLEEEWVKDLKKQYPQSINQSVWNKTLNKLEK